MIIKRQLDLSNFDVEAKIGHLFIQLSRAISLIVAVQQVPIACDSKKSHKRHERFADESMQEVNDIVAEIFVALTGKKVVRVQYRR